MSNILKKATIVLAVIASLFTAPNVFATDAADMPCILTLRSNIYGYQGPENNFTIYLGSTEKDCEFYVAGPKTQEYIWVDPWTLGKDDDGSNAAIATAVHLSVAEYDSEIRIYGDASKLDYIDVHGCYLSALELSDDLNNLTVLDASHNELTRIDLRNLKSLQSIDILDNAFADPEYMMIGKNHPDLQILSVGINDVIDPDFDLKNYPRLQYFSARNNMGLTHVDPSGCPDLVSLVLEVTNVEKLDVSKNTKLDVLNISNTKITDIDLSNNPSLGEFYASHEGSYNVSDAYKLTKVDVSKNPQLQYLDLGGNKLTEIDLTNNPRLKLLFLQRNLLSHIDLSKQTALATVNLSYNRFNFATLPLPGYGWDYTYLFSPIPVNFKYKVGDTIDLSSEVIRPPYQDASGNTVTPATFATVFAVPRAGDPYELNEQDYPGLYTYDAGKITFHQVVEDSVYVAFHCTAFDDWGMETTPFKLKTAEDFDAPSTAFAFTPNASLAGQTVSFKMAAAPVVSGVTYPADAIIKVGDSSTEFKGIFTDSKLQDIKFTLPADGGKVEVLVTDGFGAKEITMDGISLSSVDVSPAEALTNLAITNASLRGINLQYNRALRSLDLSGNQIVNISLDGIRGDYEKFYLTDVNLSNNNLTSISAVYYDIIENLNLANNRFTNFEFKYYEGLKSLDISNNILSGELDLTKCTKLENLNVAGNTLSEVKVSNWNRFKSIDLRNNNFNFATLPIIYSGEIDYLYAPQNPFSILAGGAAVNLSEQNISGRTNYVWKYTSTKEPVSADGYTLEYGVTRFNPDMVGQTVYCEMTNEYYPQFEQFPLTTTNFTVQDKPTNLVATLTPSVTGGNGQIGFRFATSGAKSLYIDWNGDGSQYDEYIYDYNNSAIYRDTKPVAGKTAKIYSFEDPEDVVMFFTNNLGLSDIDLSLLSKAQAIDIHNAGLKDGNIKLPQSSDLYELVLDGNAFETQTFPGFDKLTSLNLGGNNYTEFDLSIYPGVRYVQLANNRISNIKFGGNNALYQLDLNGNRLSQIDLSGLPGLTELLLPDNLFKTIDLSPVKDKLQALHLSGNYFTFETLPHPSQFNSEIFNTYYYANQHPIDVECREGNVDLSSQAYVLGTPTVYRWFLGDKQSDVYYDDYLEEIQGEELEGVEVNPDDPEYEVENGITYFRYTQKRRVICAMTNPELPNLILYTTPTAIDKVSGVENVAVDSECGLVDVYNLSGVCVKRQVLPAQSTDGLAPGIYVIKGHKVFVR